MSYANNILLMGIILGLMACGDGGSPSSGGGRGAGAGGGGRGAGGGTKNNCPDSAIASHNALRQKDAEGAAAGEAVISKPSPDNIQIYVQKLKEFTKACDDYVIQNKPHDGCLLSSTYKISVEGQKKHCVEAAKLTKQFENLVNSPPLTDQ